MRKIASVSVCALIASLGAMGTATADTPRCVSRHEFNRVATGMTMQRVHQIFDTHGAVTGLGAPNELRHYRPCTAGGLVQITFSPQGRLISKSAHWFG